MTALSLTAVPSTPHLRALVPLLLSAGAAWSAGSGSADTPGHRAACAGAALLVVGALAHALHVVLVAQQPAPTGPDRRGLRAGVLGVDGRASTSKAQVVLWTGAVLVVLVQLLLLDRSTPGAFAAALDQWRPEYLVLLGLPVAAATVAGVAVTTSNGGHGPVPTTAGQPDWYVRDPATGRRGVARAVVDLVTTDDGTLSWPDLQYCAFTLVALVHVMVSVVGDPAAGLPAVPAALLTLMGVSASAYTTSKVLETRGVTTPGA